MKSYSEIKVWNFELPPYPREGLFHLFMSENCQISRWLKYEAGQQTRKHQLDIFTDMASLRRFQKSLRKKLWEKMGAIYDSSLDLDVTEFGKIQCDGYTITKLIYQSRPGIYVTALLYVPKGKGPFPAILQMHGHDPLGKFGNEQQHTASDLVQNGFVCLTVDAIGTFERGEKYAERQYHGGPMGAAIFNIGETLLGAQVVDNMRAVDLLCSLDFVQKDKIGAVGASGGGNQTMWVSAMDERIAASAPVVSVGSFESYVYGINCMCELLPDGLTLTDEAGILALIAPRPLRLCNALYDCNHDFSVAEMLKTYHQVERLYWALGKSQSISFEVANQIHGMYERQQESVLGFFSLYLKGEGIGRPLPLPPFEAQPIEMLKMFKKQRPEKVCTLSRHYKRTGIALRNAFLARPEISAADAMDGLKTILRFSPNIPALKLHRFAEVDGIGRFALEVGEHLLPMLVRPGRVPGKYKILLHPEGKAGLSADFLAKEEKDGATLVLLDLFGAGETAQPNNLTGLYHQFIRQFLWIGKSVVGEWCFDILAIAKLLKTQFQATEITVTGLREMGIAALFASVFTDSIAKVIAVDSPASLLFDDSTVVFNVRNHFEKFLPDAIYSAALSMPGFLKWGDISLAVALSKAKVEFPSMRTFDGTPYDNTAVSAWKKEVKAIGKKLF